MAAAGLAEEVARLSLASEATFAEPGGQAKVHLV